MMQVIARLQHNHRCIRYVALVAITLGICCSIMLIQTCSHLCCGSNDQSHNLVKASTLGKGFQVSIRNLAAASSRDSQAKKGWRWIFAWIEPIQSEAAIVEAISMKAELVARESREKEMQAHVTVDAVLRRRAKRHRDLVKQLEERGWDLSLAEKLSQASLKSGCTQLALYLRSPKYLQARRAKLQRSAGRGILIAAGGGVPLTNTFVAIHMLRTMHGCSLPVHVYYNGTAELDAGTKAFFESRFSNVRCINVAGYHLPPHLVYTNSGRHFLSQQQSGWVLKVLMLYLTSFKEVLVLDADNVPLADPTFLFEDPMYKKAGSLFWPDYWSSNWHNPGPIYDLLNMTNPWETNPDILTTESGEFLFNREMHPEVMEWIMFLNMHANMLYSIVWGDKDTYRLAFHLAGKNDSFAQVNRRPANAMAAPFLHPRPIHVLELDRRASESEKRLNAVELGLRPLVEESEHKPPKAYDHAGMIQMAPDGAMLFLHRTAGCKLDPNLEYPPNYRPVDFVSPPLTPRQAAHVHIAGEMGIEKFDTERAQLCPHPVGLNLTGMADNCGMLSRLNPEGRGIIYDDVSKFFPVPLFDVTLFPQLQELLEASMLAFRYIQYEYRSERILFVEPSQSREIVA